MNFTVFANCQSAAIARTLLENPDFSTKYQLNAIKPIQTLTKENIDEVVDIASMTDLFIYQPTQSTPIRPTELSSDGMLSVLKATAICISFPSVYFDGYFPHLQTMEGRKSVLNFVHDYIIAYCAVKKLDKSTTLELISDSTLYSKALSDELCEGSLQNLEKREQFNKTDIRLSGFIRDNFRKVKLFNQFNHPTRPLFLHLANEVFSSIGCKEYSSNTGSEYLDRIRTPIYKSTYANLSLEFKEDFKTYNSILGRNVSQELIVEKLLAFYAQTDQNWLRAIVLQNKPFVIEVVEKWLDRQ